MMDNAESRQPDNCFEGYSKYTAVGCERTYSYIVSKGTRGGFRVGDFRK